MKLSALLAATAYLIESVGTPGQWDRPTYLTAINWACREASTLGSLTFKEVAGTIAVGQNTIPLASTPLKLLGVRTMANKYLLETTPFLEAQRDPTWRTRVGTPNGWFLENGNTIRLNYVMAAGGNLTVEVLETPTALVNDIDPVDARISDQVQDALRFLAAGYLLSQAGDQEDQAKSAAFMQQGRVLILGGVK